MMNHVRMLAVAVAVLGLLLASCDRNRRSDEAGAGEPVPPATSGDTRGVTSPAQPGGTALGSEAEAIRALLSQIIIYFDYDSSEIRPDFTRMIQAHARQLGANPNLRVRLEGHADDRGSREYNIALGERRAQAVRQALQLQGAGAAQLSTVSYGEERPMALGHDEASWAKNRRVELVYAN
jgi:peptidoglycan-associated lipoprotein